MSVVVAVIQARMGSTRLPGKVLVPIAGRPIILWTVAATRAVPGIDEVVVATTTEPRDDALVEVVRREGVKAHRGPTQDVLTRVWEAAEPFGPDHVVRATADNPLMDPEVVSGQLRHCIAADLDYVGTSGWPLGIAAEVARARALAEAYREARDPAEREHVMPFLYTHPERYRIGSTAPAGRVPAARFTVDTAEDVAFVRALAARLRPGSLGTIDRLLAILDAEPGLVEINRNVRQKDWREVQG